MNHHNEATAEILKQALTMAFSLGANARDTDAGCLPVGADVVTIHRYTDEALAALAAQRVPASVAVDQQQTGVYGKFAVRRVDGRDAPGGDRHGADYFVLDVTHDRFAKPALVAYAQACAGDYALLAQDLVTRYDLGDSGELIQPAEQDDYDIDLSDLEAEGKRVYRITHHYNIGNQDVYVEDPTGEVDGKRIALYCWYKACDWFGTGALISDLGIASVMVSFYGFRHCATHPFSTTVDLYHDAEGIGAENYQALMNDASLHRDGLREAMAPHIEGAEMPVSQTLTQPAAPLCELPPCGVPDTPPAVNEWVEQASAAVREQLTGAISASVWAYRLGGTEYLCCDLIDTTGAAWPMTVVAAGTLNVDRSFVEPHTTDLAEALHLAALLVKALGASATFGRV